jgi:DNA-binding PadR family transcriptional regulator
MSETSTATAEASIVRLFSTKSDGRLKAGDLKQKLGLGSKKGAIAGIDATEADRLLAHLLDQGLIVVVGGSKDGHHPRPNATYRLSDKGKEHLQPPKPEIVESQLQAQEAFILLQVFRAKEQKLTRSELNGKLKTVAAVGQLEFDVKAAPETVSYHLANLVKNGLLEEQKKGVSTSYTLNPEQGAIGLASMKQHDGVTFTMTGETLNALLAASILRQSPAHPIEEEAQSEPTSVSTLRPISEPEIIKYISDLKSKEYAGKDLIPIHEVRRLVARNHGQEAASHPAFDPVLRRMRSDGQLDLIAISDGRDATQQEMDDSIPGLNETIFYIVVK